MILNAPLREMLSDMLADAVDAARESLADDTIMARCTEGEWLVEVGGEPVAVGLTYEGAIAALHDLD